MHRIGVMSCVASGILTLVLIVLGSDFAGLACGVTGIALIVGAFFDDVSPRSVRAVMGAAGLALALFGLVPWAELATGHVS